jgi:hypothetical protein
MTLRPILGVFIGGLADIALTTVLSIPLMVYAMVAGDLTSLPPEEMSAQLMTMLTESPGLQITGWILGLTATVLGGYIAAWIAQSHHARYGALSAWLCMLLGVTALLGESSTAPLWQHLLAFVLSPVGGALGGSLRERVVLRRASVAPAV